jgi:hypothetical protein
VAVLIPAEPKLGVGQQAGLCGEPVKAVRKHGVVELPCTISEPNGAPVLKESGILPLKKQDGLAVLPGGRGAARRQEQAERII